MARMMQRKNELDRGLKLWGPIKPPISDRVLQSWERIEPESIISLYRRLIENSAAVDLMVLKRRKGKTTGC